jgi:hypothetical protein
VTWRLAGDGATSLGIGQHCSETDEKGITQVGMNVQRVLDFQGCRSQAMFSGLSVPCRFTGSVQGPLQPQSGGLSSFRPPGAVEPGWTACFETAARPLTALSCAQYCLAQPTLPQSDSVAPLGGVLKITSVSNSILSLPPAKTLFCGHHRSETVKQFLIARR